MTSLDNKAAAARGRPWTFDPVSGMMTCDVGEIAEFAAPEDGVFVEELVNGYRSADPEEGDSDAADEVEVPRLPRPVSRPQLTQLGTKRIPRMVDGAQATDPESGAPLFDARPETAEDRLQDAAMLLAWLRSNLHGGGLVPNWTKAFAECPEELRQLFMDTTGVGA